MYSLNITKLFDSQGNVKSLLQVTIREIDMEKLFDSWLLANA